MSDPNYEEWERLMVELWTKHGAMAQRIAALEGDLALAYAVVRAQFADAAQVAA